MVWPNAKEGRGECHQEDDNNVGAVKQKKGTQEKMAREDMKENNTTECMTEGRSVWHKKIKAGPLLHGGGR